MKSQTALWALGIACPIVFAGCSNATSAVPSAATPFASAPAKHTLSREFDPTPLPSVQGRRSSDRFPNVELTTHDGRRVRFVDDLIRDRIVAINFSYTKCRGTCPGTNLILSRIRKKLKDEFGPSLTILSLTLEPEIDTPEVLARFADRWGAQQESDRPSWLFLTGKKADLEAIRYALGQYELDPVLDADITQHAALITFGNDRLDRWATLPSGTDDSDLVKTMIRILGNSQQQRYRHVLPDETVVSLVPRS